MSRLLRAEWTKFWSVRRWVVATVASAVLTVVMSAFLSSMAFTDANDAPAFEDRFRFVHQPLAADGAVVARVASQASSHEWAKAGVMVKTAAVSGAPYAALFVTPGHGVRLQANFDTDIPGSVSTAPVWLRLTRSGPTVTAEESADGTAWRPVGTVTIGDASSIVEIGLFVASPGVVTVEREFGSTNVHVEPTLGSATFDNVQVMGTVAGTAGWRHEDVGPRPALSASSTEGGGTFTVSGSGDVVRLQRGDNDVVMDSLAGVLLALIFVVVVSVLTMSAEFRRGTIRTTFVASPERGRVLIAKAMVVASVMFMAGLIACAGSYVLARPMLRANGFAPPAYPELGLFEGPVPRVIAGTALALAMFGVLSLAVTAILRRGAAAIALLLAILVVPLPLLGALPLEIALWFGRATPMAGLAIMQTRTRWDTAIEPWAGLGVLAGYAAVALAVAVWRIRRRDA